MPASGLLPSLVAASLVLAGQPSEDIALSADRLELEEASGVLVATGNVVLERQGLRLEAVSLRFDRASGRGSIAGPLRLTGPDFEVEAARATFDLRAKVADLHAFRGRWARRAQFAGERLHLREDLIELTTASGTTCMHPEPDLALAAQRFRYYPKSSNLNFSASGVTLEALGRQILAMPELNTTVGEERQAGFDAFVFPSFAFDVYQGFLTATKFDFTFGEGSRGAIPILFSTGRGLSAGIEHALGVGPGEVVNAVRYETPWATGQGGLRAQNAYQWRGRDGSRYELAADYRSNFNEVAVHRMPEAVWTLPYHRLGGLFSYQSELRGGYLWEEASGVNTTRLRWTAPFSTPIWRPVPAWQTWVTGAPFANHYGFTHFVGGQLTWNHREQVLPDLALTQALETVRTDGRTPFIHDRLIPADRLRLGIDKDWSPRLFTAVNLALSRLEHQGPLLPEDLALIGIYRWNCFSFQLTLRPLVFGVETRFNMLEL